MKNFTSILTVIIFFTIATSSVDAAKIPSSKVETVAVNFFWERYSQYFDARYSNLEIIESIPVYTDGKLVYHAINVNHGFILISAYDEAFPVLGYSFTDKYQQSTIHESFKEWTEQYAQQILFAVEGKAPVTKEICTTWEKYSDPNFKLDSKADFRDIEPMLTSTWDQGKYYNQACPADPLGAAGRLPARQVLAVEKRLGI